MVLIFHVSFFIFVARDISLCNDLQCCIFSPSFPLRRVVFFGFILLFSNGLTMACFFLYIATPRYQMAYHTAIRDIIACDIENGLAGGM